MMKKFKTMFISILLPAAVILEDIGICSIASYIRQYGYEAKIISDEFDKIKIADIIEYQPDIIGFATYNQNMEYIKRLIDIIKESLPTVKICLGGTTATFYADEIMQDIKAVDYIVCGEGELIFKDLIDCLYEGKPIDKIDGLVFRKADGGIIQNRQRTPIQNLDILPFPARDILKDHKLKIAILSTARGCTHNCSFCVSHNYWKYNDKFNWRSRSVDRILDEIEMICHEHHIKHFWFSDPSFEDPNFNRERMIDIAQGLLARKLDILYIIYARADFYKKADEELMRLLSKSGLTSVFIGFESADPNDIKLYGKAASVDDVHNSMSFFKKYDIAIDVGFINFNPYSTFESLRNNAKFLKQYGYFTCEHYLSKVMIFKGSRMYERVKRDGLLIEDSYKKLFSYKFVDERVGRLSDFLSQYFMLLRQRTHALEEITLLTHLQESRLNSLKRKLDMHNTEHKKILTVVHSYEENFKADQLAFNNKIGDWFTGLIDLCENRAEEKMLIEHTDRYIDIDYLNQFVSKFKKNKLQLLKKIAQVEPKYIYYL